MSEGLVEKVTRAIEQSTNLDDDHERQARAAIRVTAEWLRTADDKKGTKSEDWCPLRISKLLLTEADDA